MKKRILYLGLDPSYYIGDGEIVHFPIIKIFPRPLSDPIISQALQSFDHYSHVIVTSKSAVAILSDYLLQLGMNLEIWKSKITLAVGKVTAKHLQKNGIIPFKIAREETAEGMIHELQQMSLINAHVFWPHSAQSRPLIHHFLIGERIQHTICALYDTQVQVPQNLPHLETFDEIIFTSPSTVDAFLNIFRMFPNRPLLTPIGPVTANYLNAKLNLKRR